MLDLFCGRFGWSKAFLARGWECIGVDLVRPEEVPQGIEFVTCNVLQLRAVRGRVGVPAEIIGFLHSWKVDFICASPPCQEFSVIGMPCFFKDPPYPETGVKLFNHARQLCWEAKVPHVIENVRAAQGFVGNADHHCGAFHLWGTGVPPLMPQGISKGFSHGGVRKKDWPHDHRGGSLAATIPPELSNCVAEYAERILEAQVHSVL